ncbi:MAG: ATP-dependent helicase/nuclease subunit [Pyrinomonadaceae bacterium]|nr:ATP-dependent helicase/nuclease subunit [Pyrinomonadaceae bacterium]
MSKEIWLGPLLGNNRSRLIKRCAELVSQGKSETFLYLAASHPLLELVTEEILDGGQNAGLWGELPVYLFRGFVRKIVATAVDEETGARLTTRVPIDREEFPLKRSLVSQILKRLAAEGKLKALDRLAAREGCVNSIATLIGEIQRAGKRPEEFADIVARRVTDVGADQKQAPLPVSSQMIPRQVDFDSDVALIYSLYCKLLDQHQLTDADADQLRAVSILDAAIDGRTVGNVWLPNVKLLVLDGFFDFTPVQGEILRRLIPQVSEVIVNLNNDQRNPEIFLPFQQTIDQLKAIAPFEIKYSGETSIALSGALAGLRESLFNPAKEMLAPADDEETVARDSRTDFPVCPSGEPVRSVEAMEERADGKVCPTQPALEIRYLECGDRDTEIRTIAKQIKQLILVDGFKLSDIALVVRQRAAYAETIARVMREESLPCNLELQLEAGDIPANRAALKLLAIVEELSRDEAVTPRTSDLADLIKSEYFRLNDEEVEELAATFDAEHAALFTENGPPPDEKQIERLKNRYRIGIWDADALENAFAYVGSDLRISDWLTRARKLIKELPTAAATRELLNIDNTEQAREADEADQIENAETAKIEEKDVEKKRRPSHDVHPAALAWTALVIQAFAARVQSLPRTAAPGELRRALMGLFEQFSFREQIARRVKNLVEDEELPQAMLNFNSLEALRRAFAAAIKSIEIAAAANENTTKMSTFVEEARRCLSSQSQVFGVADRGGLSVLEATDVRGLRFRAIFVAGLIEGGFPLRASRDWIYPHEERERLKRYGLTLEDISPATLLKEEHYFYQAACRATERLYLTRPLLLEDDAETVASYYVDELRRAVAPLRITAETVRRDYEGKQLPAVSTGGELDVALVRQQERHLHRGEKQQLLPQPIIATLMDLALNENLLTKSALRRIDIEHERWRTAFGPYDGEITDPHLIALLQQRFGADYVLSASGLGVYGNCGYRFFGQRVLKLEPRGEAALDLQAIDAGKLLHDILRRFFERHRAERLTEVDRETLRKELAGIADDVFDEHERVVPPLNKQIWKIDREIRKILLDQVLLYELGIQEDSTALGVVPAFFELAFGGPRSAARDPNSKQEPLALSRTTATGAETLKISGQIDRVDVARDKTLIAYDYKLSSGASLEDIKSGRSLQLPIYLEALEKLLLIDHRIAGGGYYVIRGGNERRNRGLHRASAIEYSGIGKKAGAVIGDDEWQDIRANAIAKIWDFLDHMRAGHFFVNPSEKKKTCRFCDFAAVCRYDRYRIDRKK